MLDLYLKKHQWVLGGFEYLHADDVVADAGSGGATFRTDQLAGLQHVPYTKLMSGTADSEEVIPGDAANGLDVDVTRLIPGTGATALGKAVDAAAGATDTGVASLAVRDDSLTTLTPADGDYTHLRVSSVGRLWVDGSGVTQPVSDAGGSLTMDSAQLPASIGQANAAGSLSVVLASDVTLPLPTGAATSARQDTQITALQLLDDVVFTDDAAFTPGTSKVSMVGAEFDDTTPDSVDEGDAGALRMSARRELYIQVRDAAGNERGLAISAGGAALVDGSATTQPISAASLPLPTGAATSANQSTSNTHLATLAGAVSGTEMQVDIVASAAIPVPDNGGSLTMDSAQLPASLGQTTMANSLAVAIASNQSALQVVGAAAADAAVSGNPLLIGFRASQDETTAVSADGDVVHPWADRFGRLVILPGHPNPEAPASVNVTNSGNNTVIAAPGASLSLYIKKGSIHNRGASNIVALLQDGAGGTTRWRAELASEGGASGFSFGERGWKLTADTLLNVNLSGAGDVDVNITEYYIAP
jgi:hypothetical protein